MTKPIIALDFASYAQVEAFFKTFSKRGYIVRQSRYGTFLLRRSAPSGTSKT
ncbi:hypothetical protein PROCOU_04291 [Listeria rocourtiae FSL F6-920]|nr:hypothetical protein PROCOU_04291 [Listeria rocourtiae FSL F6-920]